MRDSFAPSSAATQALPPGSTVLQVLPALGHGGVERGTLEIAGAVLAAGGRALVACEAGPNMQRLQRMGGEHIDMKLASKNPLIMRANGNKLADLIRRENVSLIHARSRAPAWSAKRAAAATSTPFVTTYHAAYNENGALKRRYNSVMASGDRVIAISHYIADLIQQRYATPASKVRVIHRGVDLKAFDPDAVGGGRLIQFMKQWGLNEESHVVLLPARLTRWKGHAVLIAAFAKLVQSRDLPNLVCVMAGADNGSGDYRRELERYAEKLKLPAYRIVFAGHCDDMSAAMHLADVVVSASTDPEGFGRIMAEAAAMGTPVIASAHGPAPEIVVEGETGWLVPPGEPEPMAAALGKLFDLSPGERDAMATKAKQRARQLFSSELMCQRTLAVYRELLSKPA